MRARRRRWICLVVAALALFAGAPARPGVATDRELVWTRDGTPTTQALAVIAILADASSRGLDPEDYDGPRWADRIARLSRPGTTAAASELARFDATLTAAATRFASDLQWGRIAQPPIRWHLGPGDVREDLDAFMHRLPASGDVGAAFTALEPPFPAYRRTRDALERYRRLAREDPAAPLARRVRQLELTLERWRWVPRWLAPPFVVVNIPEFRLYASDGRGQRLSMKVVVGRAYRWQTPVFAADMTALVFRPSWTVPRRMLVAELAPKVEKEPGFLAADGYEAIDRSGKVVPFPEDRHELAVRLRSGALGLRQRPGPRNALGGLKFLLPNPHDVYLHDTPSQQLFARSRRDFSHGCIRVEDPVALAAWALGGAPDWPVERIRASMTGGATLRVPLPAPVPVLIVYGTAIVAEGGEVRFFDDIYHHDAQLERALAVTARVRR